MYTMTHSCVLNIFKTSAYRQLWIFNMYTPGQWPDTHVLESREEPIHCLPPFWGGGLSHSLVRNCSPTPQVLLHNPQDVHSENRPWTVNRPNKIKYNLSFTNLLVKLVLDPVFSVEPQASLILYDLFTHPQWSCWPPQWWSPVCWRPYSGTVLHQTSGQLVSCLYRGKILLSIRNLESQYFKKRNRNSFLLWIRKFSFYYVHNH